MGPVGGVKPAAATGVGPVAAARRHAPMLRAFTAAALLLSLLTNEWDPNWHAVAGAAFVVAVSAHLLGNGRWIRTVGRRVWVALRAPRRGDPVAGLPRTVTIDAVLAATTVTLVVAVAVSGVTAFLNLAGTIDAPGAAPVHGGCAFLLVVLVAVHVVRHRHRLWRRRTGNRPAASGRQPA